MEIKTWFQGSMTCDGVRKNIGVWEGHHSTCLYTQAQLDKLTQQEQMRLAGIIERLFSGRTGCAHCDFSPIQRMIHFNNHPETTREDINKVLGVFNEEGELK